MEQAGFQSGRSCTDQVLALKTCIESGFQAKLKPSVALLDPKIACDTVWKDGVI